MTRLIQPVPVVNTTTITNTTATATVNTTTVNTATTAKSLRPRHEGQSEDWQLPVRVARASRNNITILPSTAPELVVRSSGTADTGDMPNKNPSHPNKTSNSTKSNQKKTSPAAIVGGRQVNLAPEQEWFQLLKKDAQWSASQRKRMEELLKAHPALAVASEGKGDKARSALFHALSHGKPAAVRLIMDASVKQNLHEMLVQVFGETMMISDQVLEALKICLSQFSKPELETLRQAIEKKYTPSDILKNIASGFLDVLQSFGLDFKEGKQSDNSSQKSGQSKKRNLAQKSRSGSGNKPLFNVSQLKIGSTIDLNPIPEEGRELARAAHLGDTDEVIALLKTDSADKQALVVDSMGANALLHAAVVGHVGIVKELKKLKSIEE